MTSYAIPVKFPYKLAVADIVTDLAVYCLIVLEVESLEFLRKEKVLFFLCHIHFHCQRGPRDFRDNFDKRSP